MSLVNITDFDEALVLLGLYEQEVMKTGILDYPAQWPKPPSLPLPQPEPTPVKPEKEQSAPIPSSPSQPITAPPSPFSTAVPTINNTDNSTTIVNNNQAVPIPRPLPETIQSAHALPELTYEAKHQKLLTEQEKERRLFYLFVEELERTGDLRKLPAVLHSPSRR